MHSICLDSASYFIRDVQGTGSAPKQQPCNEIIDRLFLGTSSCAENINELQQRGIGLTIAIGNSPKLEETEVDLACTVSRCRESSRTGFATESCDSSAIVA